jgi:hypothetical protein
MYILEVCLGLKKEEKKIEFAIEKRERNKMKEL